MPAEHDTRTRGLLADDEPLVRAGLAMLLDAENDLVVVGEADDGTQAVALAGSLHPHVVVMDVRMPRCDGVEATRQLVADEFVSRTGVIVPVLILTTFNEDRAVYEALRAGASGFLLKNAAPRALADAIRAVAAGRAWLDPAVARLLLDEFAGRPDLSLPSTRSTGTGGGHCVQDRPGAAAGLNGPGGERSSGPGSGGQPRAASASSRRRGPGRRTAWTGHD